MMNSKKYDYLSQIPKQSRYIGDHKKGEIEIAQDPDLIAEIHRKYRERLIALGLAQDNKAEDLGIVFKDEYITIVRDPVIFPKSTSGTYFRIFESSCLDGGPAGVVMLPYCNGLIYLRKIFRHATRQWEIEFPRGYKTANRDPIEAVKNEISEEIGLEIISTKKLGIINPNTGMLVGPAYAYFVALKYGEPAPHPEDGEAFGEILKLTKDQLMEKIRNGEIRDGYTLAALQLAQACNLLPI